MTTLAPPRRSMWQLIVSDIADLIAAQPPQALLSVASMTIVASEAATMVPWPANIALAAGAEWAYLRGIASSGRGSPVWTRALNWGALLLVIIYGMLWGARKFGAISDTPAVWAAWTLTALHILPVAFVSFAAAMVHRSAVEGEAAEYAEAQAEARERQRRREADEDAREAEKQRRLDAIEADKAARLAEIEAEKAKHLARIEYRTAAAQLPAQQAPHEPHTAAQSAARQIGRDELCALVRAAYAANPAFSRADMARQTGWSEAMIRKVIKEITEEVK